MDTKHLLGKRIKELRKCKKLSQEQLAEMVGFESSNSCLLYTSDAADD